MKGNNFKSKTRKKYCFKRVDNFNYLWVQISRRIEIRNRIVKRNISASSLLKVLKAKYITRNVKLGVYHTVILPTVLYGCETWILNKAVEIMLRIWKRKVLWKILGVETKSVWKTMNEIRGNGIVWGRQQIKLKWEARTGIQMVKQQKWWWMLKRRKT